MGDFAVQLSKRSGEDVIQTTENLLVVCQLDLVAFGLGLQEGKWMMMRQRQAITKEQRLHTCFFASCNPSLARFTIFDL